jgi:hypothetical protein
MRVAVVRFRRLTLRSTTGFSQREKNPQLRRPYARKLSPFAGAA